MAKQDNAFFKLYGGSAQLSALESLVRNGQIRRAHLKGMLASSAPLLLSCLGRSLPSCSLFVLETEEEAGYFYQDLQNILKSDKTVFFPSPFKRAAKYGQRDSASEILRSEVLGLLEGKVKDLRIVTYPEALLVKVAPKKVLESSTLKITKGQMVDMHKVTDELDAFHFQYVDYVYEPGQYAQRGSIIDVFSYSSEYPYRIDFFGDEVESVRTFEVETQLSKDVLDEVVILPEMDSMSEASEMVSFLEYLPGEAAIFVKDLEYTIGVMDKASKEALTSQAIQVNSLLEDQKEAVLSLEGRLLGGAEFLSKLETFRILETGNHAFLPAEASLGFNMTPQPLFHKNFELLTDSLKEYVRLGYRIYITSDSLKQIQRLETIFRDRGDDIPFQAIDHTLHEGFIDDTARICLLTDHQIFDRFHKYSLRSERARNGKVALTLKELKEFQIGDYVVHSDHGIGKFGGLVRIPNGATTQECIKIIYENDDVVFVSIHALHKVSKYRGKEGQPPRLSHLGTGAWEKLKDRTKHKLKDIARELIQLYAARKQKKGYQFSPDGFLQHELEASFLYEDTPDQGKATQMVKQDMESSLPMDRLVCGDVGFGKTEVAVRAAFKAACDGKQVAVLVPTTVLAFQHYNTFKDRLQDMPCQVEYMSRARSGKDLKRITKELEEGKIDILIGTQKILGKEIKFKDLGLLIIDEEQKFGVGTKEKLRQMKVNVDTLTLTATPIPRTLQFSLMGARDLSVIQTPPPNRYPVQTEVHLWSKDVIVDAINFEMSRNGQVYFVCNRIASLAHIKSIINTYIPDCRVAIGHGQMDPKELENIVFDFVNHECDVLLSTTIVENGIDIPNANTIIIQDAHHFGLSDLHQMRGRVGRSNRKAFCYLLAPPLSGLTPEARRRLEAIEHYSGLGSGIQIAMQDLDIRGAGNLLGAEQSGFIADLGYETYQKVLSEAIRELKSDEFSQLFQDNEEDERERTRLGMASASTWVEECQVESDLELLMPATYVSGSSERMLLYRELDSLSTDDEVAAFRSRLEDRFGKLPRETEELLQVVPMRRIAATLGVEKIILKAGNMSLGLVQDAKSSYYDSDAFSKFISYYQSNFRSCELREKTPGKRSMLVKGVRSIKDAVTVLRAIEKEVVE